MYYIFLLKFYYLFIFSYSHFRVNNVTILIFNKILYLLDSDDFQINSKLFRLMMITPFHYCYRLQLSFLVFINTRIILILYLYMIKYHNYLYDKVNGKFLSNFIITDPSRTASTSVYEFRFSISPEESRIKTQAELFAKYYLGEGKLVNSYIDSNQRSKAVLELLACTYVYSYVKAVYYSCNQALKPATVSMSQRTNLVFHGHKLLFDYISEGLLRFWPVRPSHINIQIDDVEETLKEIQKFQIFVDNYDPKYETIQNPQYDMLLDYLNRQPNMLVSVSNLADRMDQSVTNLLSSPIGNACFNEDITLLQYVESRGINSDPVSIFWNTAVVLTSLKVPSVDITDSVYDDTPVSRISNYTVCYEVESITGYNPFRPFHAVSDIGKSGGNAPTGPKPTGGNPSKGSGSKSSGTKPSPATSKQPTISKGVNKVVQVSGQAMTLIQNTGKILEDANVQIVLDLINSITGKKLGLKKFRNKYLGRNLDFVFKDNGVPTTGFDPDEVNSLLYHTDDNNNIVLAIGPKTTQLINDQTGS